MYFHPTELFVSPGMEAVVAAAAKTFNKVSTQTLNRRRKFYNQTYGKQCPKTYVDQFLEFLEARYKLPETVTLPEVLEYAKTLFAYSNKGSSFHKKLKYLRLFVQQAAKHVWPYSLKRLKRQVAEFIAMNGDPRLKKFYCWAIAFGYQIDELSTAELNDYKEWLADQDYKKSSVDQYHSMAFRFAKKFDKRDKRFASELDLKTEPEPMREKHQLPMLSGRDYEAYRSIYLKGYSFPLQTNSLIDYLSDRGEAAKKSGVNINETYFKRIVNKLGRVSKRLGYEDIRLWEDLGVVYNAVL